MELRIIYQDKDLLAIDKPAGMDMDDLQRELPQLYPELKNLERSGIIHRLDKNTSGLLLTAKTKETLIFFQKQFKNRDIEKRYLALVSGKIEENQGRIDALIGRSPKDRTKQKAYLPLEPGTLGKRQALTEYKVVKRLEDENEKAFTLLEVYPKTGRKHQIRVHLAHIHHPIAGDEIYGFKGQPIPKGLSRQFLHAGFLKIKMPDGGTKEFYSELPDELKEVLQKLYDQDTRI